MTLMQFVIDFCKKPFGGIVTDLFEAENVEPVAKIVLHRDPPFQVTLIAIWHPHIFIPEHRHPSVDTIQVLLSGQLTFFVDNKKKKWEPLGIETNEDLPLLRRTLAVPRNALHTAKTGKSGAVWWSFEEWGEGSMSTTVDDWDGVAFSHDHYEHLQNRKLNKGT
jgi:hypothetical protein